MNVAGTTVTGAFDLSTVAGAFMPAGLPAGDYLLQPGAVYLSFDVLAIGQTVNFTSAGSGENSEIKLTDNGTMQSLLLAPAFVDPHMITTEELTGPEGSLFSDIDNLASLHIGPGVSLSSPIFLSVFQEGGATLQVTSEALNSVPVPVPSSWPVLATSLLALWATIRFRRSTARQRCRAFVW